MRGFLLEVVQIELILILADLCFDYKRVGFFALHPGMELVLSVLGRQLYDVQTGFKAIVLENSGVDYVHISQNVENSMLY